MIFLYLGLILLSIGVIGFIFLLNVLPTCGDTPVMICVTLFCVGVITLMCHVFDSNMNPTAIDVYRGKTIIEVTYKNGVAIDSTVVFK